MIEFIAHLFGYTVFVEYSVETWNDNTRSYEIFSNGYGCFHCARTHAEKRAKGRWIITKSMMLNKTLSRNRAS